MIISRMISRIYSPLRARAYQLNADLTFHLSADRNERSFSQFRDFLKSCLLDCHVPVPFAILRFFLL